MVAGLRVATIARLVPIRRYLRLPETYLSCRLLWPHRQSSGWACSMVRNGARMPFDNSTYDFFGRRMAVETSLGPGGGAAPLGSMFAVKVVVGGRVKIEWYASARERRASPAFR